MPVDGIPIPPQPPPVVAMTDAQLYAETRKAIDALTTGGVNSYSLNGRSVTKLDLDELWQQAERLELRMARAEPGRGGMFRVGTFRRPT